MKKTIIFALLIAILFSLSAQKQEVDEPKENHKVFEKLKDEYKLASYFLTYQQKKYYKKLSEEDKWRYLATFWKANDLDPTTEQNEFLDQIKTRIEYCNAHFTHFKSGWNTDRGRIYIRHGQPYEIIKRATSMNTKYAQKDYEIWKYRIVEYLTYIFIDLQQHGDYRLIYSENDPQEGSFADWQSYLGRDFDFGLLY